MPYDPKTGRIRSNHKPDPWLLVALKTLLYVTIWMLVLVVTLLGAWAGSTILGQMF